MKHIKHLITLLIFCLAAPSLWASTSGLASANPAAVSQFIQSHGTFVFLSAFFGLGVLLAFTPCVLPMVPILSGIIVGQEDLSSAKAFILSFSYVMGMAFTYAIAGMLAGYMGSTLQTLMQTPVVIIGFSLVFVVMALSMFGLFELRLPTRFNSRLNAKKQQSYWSAAAMGVMSTLVVSPCVTAPLIGVLTYIGQNGQVGMGGLILFVMALGMGLPLLLVGAGYGAALPKAGSWMVKIKHFFGFIMLAIALWMLSRILPPLVIQGLVSLLLIAAFLVIGWFRSKTGKNKGFFQLIRLDMILIGGVLAYNVFNIYQLTSTTDTIKPPFVLVHSQEELAAQLDLAKKERKKVFVEFFAGWCPDCQAMDKKVFNQKDVNQAMSGLITIRVDISEKTNAVSLIKKQYQILGIPSMRFFAANGEPLSQWSAAGYIDKGMMLQLLGEVQRS